MDSKKKKKIIIISVCVSVVAIIAIVLGTVFGVRAANSNKPDSNSGTNVNTVIDSNTYNEAIATKQVPQDFNGVYQFKNVRDIRFAEELTASDIEKLCINMTSMPDINNLKNLLQTNKEKARDKQNEKLVFFNGLYSKNLNNNPKDKGSDKGIYFGDSNLAIVETDKNITFFISQNYADIENNVPVSDKLNANKTKIYVMENVYSEVNKSRLLFTVTYIYELMDEEIKPIPDNELKFEI